ncbi:hypothetical protein [Legionella gresilensis]|uniref:hypothetical protein n=1 Tax=Legionella gresilensis TaxID=91823 RepID=UPI001041788A|nr:hypothetical protein [Legionella gresilensis]
MRFFDSINRKYGLIKYVVNEFYEGFTHGMPDFHLLFPEPNRISISYLKSYFAENEIALIYTKAMIINHLKNNYVKYGAVCIFELLDYALYLNFPEESTIHTIAHGAMHLTVTALMLSTVVQQYIESLSVESHLHEALSNNVMLN